MSSNTNFPDDIRSLPVGYVLSDYRIEGVLGHGSFGITYLATDTMLNRKVAIKEYFPREFAARDGTLLVRAAGNKEDRDNFSWGLDRFLDEARVLALFDHPNIVPVRRFFQTNGTAYLVMDYCDGTPLDSFIEAHGTLSRDQINKILYPVLDGLERIHKANFLHRDIKPANIFIKDDGSPVLLDFGAARQEMLSHSRSVTSMATPGYAAFEQYSSHGKQGPWTDIYGFGATLYRAITGEKPQDAPDRILEDTLVPCLKKAAGRHDDRLLLAIDAAMAVRPEHRPQSIGEWRRMIGVSSLPSSSSIETTQVISPVNIPQEVKPPQRVDGKAKNIKSLTISIAVGTILVITAASYYFYNAGQSKQEPVKAVSQPTPMPKVLQEKEKPPEVKPATAEVKPPVEKKSEKKEVELPPCPTSTTVGLWKNCHGTLNFTYDGHVGEKYTGDFDAEGKFTGQGTYTWPNGNMYVGSFKSNNKDGKGTFTTSGGMKYSGDYKADKLHGNGTLIFENGEKYVGTFKNGMFDGKGTYYWPSGQKYVGEYKNDQQNGQGTMFYADGRKYVGGFVNSKLSGNGTFYDAQGVKVYSGLWEDGKAKEGAPSSSSSGTSTTSSFQKCTSYAAAAKQKLSVPKRVDNLTTITDLYCVNTAGKPTFIYKYDIDSELRIDQAALDKLVREKNRAIACGPDVKMFLPIVDVEYQYYYSAATSNFAPGRMIGKLHYSDSDCN